MARTTIQAMTRRTQLSLLALSSVLLVGFAVLPGLQALVRADQYDDQINALQQQSNDNYASLTSLQSQAASYQDAINQLQAQISGLQASIDANSAKQAQIQAQIIADQQEIDKQKALLATDVKSMYVDGTPTAIEILATSKNLSEFVDKQEYRTAVQKKLQDTVAKIADLQKQLQTQKTEVDQLLAEQQQQQAGLNTARAQQASLLAYNQDQQNAYNANISANASKIADLRKQQIAANARFIGSAGTGYACGGGYPGKWCNVGQDTVFDNWGMYNRECVSYTAFRVAASGRNMPGWGWAGVGNANQWDDDARNAGIPVDSTPRAGDVAISNAGAYGHAMYVESVNANGTINISQYNAALNGLYSTNTISVGSLVFIHFP